MTSLKETDPEIALWIERELLRQQNGLELIASENFVSQAVMEAQGSVLTNKYAEGLPGKRYYGGCEFVDQVEIIAIDRVKQLFGAEHANVQPHSGAQANLAVLFALLNPGDTFMGMALDQGGHLTHGAPVNMSGKWFNCISYGVDEKTGLIDYEAIEAAAARHKPRLIQAGATNYPRIINFERLRKIADSVGAYLFADIAHIAGIIVAGLHPSPFPHAHVVTTTTHKTLRGPRGGVIMCNRELSQTIDKAVFPGTQGGPLMHVIAAKAVAFKEALSAEFKQYQKQVVDNARAMAETLMGNGLSVITGGTDNHLLCVDLRSINTTGKKAQADLETVRITVNKNTIPGDPQKPYVGSAIRIGTPAVTSRGMGRHEMQVIGKCIAGKLKNPDNQQVHDSVLKEVADLCLKFPLYKDAGGIKIAH